MNGPQERRKQIIAQLQGAMLLQTAYIGVANGLFGVFAKLGSATPEALAATAGVDPGYTTRWCDAAYAFGLLDEQAGQFRLTDLGQAFRADAPGTLMPQAIQAVLSAHMAERAAELMKTGERPGEQVLAERPGLLPWFGPMLETQFGPIFERELLPSLPVYQALSEVRGTVVDLGCGNGWYLRTLLAHYPGLRGIGLDGFEENIRQATERARAQGLSDRLSCRVGDIYHFSVDEPVDAIAMTRALHHVWDEKESVFDILKRHLKPGGVAVIWEPSWPTQRASLREPARRAMAFQNLSEHVQGNHFLRPEEIQAQFRRVGMDSEVYLFLNGVEAVVVGRRPG